MIKTLKGFLSKGQTSWNMILIGLLVLEFVIFGAANGKFLRPALLFTSINDNLPVFMISLFVTLVMVTGGIDIQVASLVGLTSITIGVGWQDFGLPIWGAVGVAFVLVVACGALSGFLIAYCRVQAMVVTLAAASCTPVWPCSSPRSPRPRATRGLAVFPRTSSLYLTSSSLASSHSSCLSTS